jgi:hypothetical protein
MEFFELKAKFCGLLMRAEQQLLRPRGALGFL